MCTRLAMDTSFDDFLCAVVDISHLFGGADPLWELHQTCEAGSRNWLMISSRITLMR